MELFDRDDLKKAGIFMIPIVMVLIIIILSTRPPRQTKKDDSSVKSYSYGSGMMPFSVTIDEKRTDLVWSEDTLKKRLNMSISPARGGAVEASAVETEDGLWSRSFNFTRPSEVTLFNGLELSDEEEIISAAFSPDCVRTTNSKECSYYWAFYLDGKEIDYTKLDFSDAEGEGAYLKSMLMGTVCEIYCRDQLLDNKAKICTSILVTTAEKKCDSCVIEVIRKEDLVIDEGGIIDE